MENMLGYLAIGLVIFLILKFLPSKDVKESLAKTGVSTLNVVRQTSALAEDSVILARMNLEASAIQADAERVQTFGGEKNYVASVEAYNKRRNAFLS